MRDNIKFFKGFSVIAFANLLLAIANILNMLLNVLLILVLARVIISWVNADPYNPIVRFITSTTDAFLLPLRKKFRMIYGSMDLSPLILLAIIYFIKFFLVQTLFDYSVDIKRSAIIGSQINAPADFK